jgi:hypothetical protein
MAEPVNAAESERHLDSPPNHTAEPPFASDHIYLVAYLRCLGHTIIGMSRNGTRVSFKFEKTPGLLADVTGFMSGAKIAARPFCFELLRLKRTLNGGKSRMEKVNKHESEEVCGSNSCSGT